MAGGNVSLLAEVFAGFCCAGRLGGHGSGRSCHWKAELVGSWYFPGYRHPPILFRQMVLPIWHSPLFRSVCLSSLQLFPELNLTMR